MHRTTSKPGQEQQVTVKLSTPQSAVSSQGGSAPALTRVAQPLSKVAGRRFAVGSVCTEEVSAPDLTSFWASLHGLAVKANQFLYLQGTANRKRKEVFLWLRNVLRVS